jgi:fatty-acyl-CoA synthase
MALIRKTIGHMIKEVSQVYSSNDALIHTEMGVQYSYSQLMQEISRIARGFIEAGIERSDKVALWAPNIPEWIVSFLALAKMGAITVPIDPGAGREDLQYILAQSECRGIIMAKGLENEAYRRMLLEVIDSVSTLEKVFVISGTYYPKMVPWTELSLMGKAVDPGVLERMEHAIAPEDAVAIMYTSGTTGKPKGVVLDHLGLINKSMASTERQGVNHTDRLSLFFPLFHMFGNTCIALAGLLRGAALIMPCRNFEPSKILKAIYDEKCTALYASPSMLIALLEHPDFQKSGWESVLRGIIGGAPCPKELMRHLVDEVGVSRIIVGYGITETSSWVTMTKPEDPVELRVSTIGVPLACNEVKIVNPRTGEELPPTTQGEICTKGFLMKEYYKMPGATAAAIDRHGWFHTGDLGEMDEKGYVKVTGRLKDVIVRSAVEIYPVEVEEIIYQLPEVTEVQVFGFPYPEKGQEVAAWVRVKEGSRLSLEEIAVHVKAQLDEAAAPRFYKFVSDFPLTRSGKVQKFKLAEMAQQEYLEK